MKSYTRDEVADAVRRYFNNDSDGAFIDALARARCHDYGEDYRTALHNILQVTPTADNAGSVTPARQRLNELLAAKEKTKFLAGCVLDNLARRKIVNISPTPINPTESYKQALADVAKEFPNLWRASRDGYLADDDFATAAQLVPAISGEVEHGNFADDNQTEVRRYTFLARNGGM